MTASLFEKTKDYPIYDCMACGRNMFRPDTEDCSACDRRARISRAGNGVPLFSTAHPVSPLWKRILLWRPWKYRLSPDAIKTVEIEVRK